jgi:hypothetical protein
MLLGNSRWKNPCKYLRASPYTLPIGMLWCVVDASKPAISHRCFIGNENTGMIVQNLRFLTPGNS